ncbi:cytochrome b-c1 complex subunit 6, mitochondrial [Diorhabda carinulata]|uniref:cytochrome b-c1 complex subunit 6, mitochondrial n=1 Tax=Diorhabda sublineata TaxID=1163346 RepID=UPI0024E18B4B|nr:cytochrome b-c1 complex subunit 6, mitochondrial [Diorhabda sublineata]XP_057668089.1 cytochrome b-c1 complex subunit 6, mitochondrial [Diorhabda carinulata]
MFFDKFLKFPKLLSVKAQDEEEGQEGGGEEEEEVELVDPQETLREQCKANAHCLKLAEKYQACNDRVNSKSHTTETCVEELFDLMHAVDHCVSKDLFSKLK